MHRKKQIALLAIFVIALLGVLIGLILKYGGASVRAALPNPNGYDDLVKAGSMVSGDVYITPTEVNLRGLVDRNTESLRLLRLGLTRTCSVPTDVAITNLLATVTNLAALKVLCYLLVAEGRLAELEHRPADAARCYLDCLRLGNAASRGGLIIHHLVGVACEAIGSDPLAKLVPAFSCELSRQVVSNLERIESDAVSWDDVRQNENAYERYQLQHAPTPVQWALRLVARWWSGGASRRKAKSRHDRLVAHINLLMTELALRCYQTEHGRPPAALQELVPNYLRSMPLDPFSGVPVIYKPQGTNWLLYSIGTDRVDDGGKPVGKGSESKGDIFFDSPW